MLTANSSNKVVGRSRERGVTLIEVLIAAVILAIGVLGVVSLLALSKSSQHESIQRVRAVALGSDLLENIRRNPAAATSYHTDFDAPIGDGFLEDEPAVCTAVAMCTATQMAARDLWVWEQRLDGAQATVTEDGDTRNTAGLRSLRGCINFEADTAKTNTGIISVVLQWQGLKESTDAVPAGGDVCGGEDAGSDPTRRQVVVNSYIVDEMEL